MTGQTQHDPIFIAVHLSAVHLSCQQGDRASVLVLLQDTFIHSIVENRFSRNPKLPLQEIPGNSKGKREWKEGLCSTLQDLSLLIREVLFFSTSSSSLLNYPTSLAADSLGHCP
jgi:hypothetical protein